MMQYIRDPERILLQSYQRVRELTDLSPFTPEQQEVVIAMVDAYGEPELAKHVRFSEHATEAARKAIKKRNNILYDEELVRYALDDDLLYQQPLSFLKRATVISLAKANRQTRAMTAVDYWKPYMEDSIILIGQAATALFRLIEILQEGAPKPALVIAAARGFSQAEPAKQLLWNKRRELGFECIVIDGMRGGAALAAAALNTLLLQHGNANKDWRD